MATFKISNKPISHTADLSSAEAGSMIVWWKAYALFVSEVCTEEQQDQLTEYFKRVGMDAQAHYSEEVIFNIVMIANESFVKLTEWMNEHIDSLHFD